DAFVFGAFLCLARERPLAAPAAWAFFALACLSKESGAVLPFLIFAVGAYDRRFRKRAIEYLPFALIFGLYFYARGRVVVNHQVVPPPRDFVLFLIREAPTVALNYLGRILVPVNLTSHRRMFFAHAWIFFSPLLLIALAVCASKSKSRAAAFGAA